MKRATAFATGIMGCVCAWADPPAPAPAPAPEPGNVDIQLSPEHAAQSENSKIIGGHPADPARWPWIVAIGKGNPANVSSYCAGTLIAPQWILTAAHCDIPAGDYVVAGQSNLSKMQPVNIFEIDTVINHPAYDAGSDPERRIHTFDNDIALLKLKTAIVGMAGVAAIPMITADGDAMSREGKSWIAGWGRMGVTRRDLPNLLQEVDVTISEQDACQRNYHAIDRSITDNMFCAGGAAIAGTGGAQTADACQGDSGGPIVAFDLADANPVLIGLISKGAGCARPAFPGVYTRLSALRCWVDKCMGENQCAACT